jgi:hypothetical protein
MQPLKNQLLSKSRIGGRRTCYNKTDMTPVEAPPATRQKNAITAVLLILLPASVYYTAIYKMSETDDLQEMIETETLTTTPKK